MDDLESWKSQLRKGAAEFAVLALLAKTSYSGIGLLGELSKSPAIGLSEGSIYPLLNRLEREGRIRGTWQTPDGGGRGQKHYNLTKDGTKSLQQMRKTWSGFRDQLSNIAGGQ